MSFVIVPPLLLLAAGAVGVYLGWRGKRIDDHPVCRRCGFDLFGAPADAERCSECGKRLADRNAIVLGNRRKRVGLILVAAVLSLASASGIGFLSWMRYRNVDWIQLKPEWMLIREAKSLDDQANRQSAIAELIRRESAGGLSKASADAITAWVLDVQADPDEVWYVGWGDLVETLRTTMAPDQWERYQQQGVHFQAFARTQVNPGDPIPVEYWLRHRLGSSGSWSLRLTLHAEFADKFHAMNQRGAMGGSFARGRVFEGMTAPPDISPGMHELQIDGGIRMRRLGSNVIAVDKKVELQFPIEILPADVPSVRLVRDPAMAAAIEKSLSVRLIEPGPPHEGRLLASIEIMAPPLDVAFDVFLRTDDQFLPLGSVTATKTPPSIREHRHYSLRTSNWNGKSTGAEVVFRASRVVAANTVSLREIWHGEIVLTDISIEPP